MIDNVHPCRSCGATGLLPILSLGRMPLANDLVPPDQVLEPVDTFPLDLVFCRECALVQITETVPPERLFREYLYFSSYSTTMVEHVRSLVTELIPARGLDEHSQVIELASNDGYLLQFYQQAGIPVLGIEPALNVAKVARERGIPTMTEFFGEAVACGLPPADIVHAHNVLAHVADLNGFVQGIKTVLKPDGMAVVEVPYVKDMIDGCEFDTIYHEHLCYFSLASLEYLFHNNGLEVREVKRVPIHGGSLLLFLTPMRQSAHVRATGQSLRRLRVQETEWRADEIGFYLDFAGRIQRLRDDLRGLLEDLRGQGRHIAAYGAAAKGVMLLNYCDIGPGLLDFVVDRNEHKQGRYIPGVGLRVYSPDALLASMPDYLLILVWNLADEIMGQQAEYRRRGGRFILPIPEPRIVYP